MRSFEAGETVVRRDVHRSGHVWSEQALRVVADGAEALVTACAPGGELRRPWRYVRACADGDRFPRCAAFEAMAMGELELVAGVWLDTELLLWKPPIMALLGRIGPRRACRGADRVDCRLRGPRDRARSRSGTPRTPASQILACDSKIHKRYPAFACSERLQLLLSLVSAPLIICTSTYYPAARRPLRRRPTHHSPTECDHENDRDRHLLTVLGSGGDRRRSLRRAGGPRLGGDRHSSPPAVPRPGPSLFGSAHTRTAPTGSAYVRPKTTAPCRRGRQDASRLRRPPSLTSTSYEKAPPT